MNPLYVYSYNATKTPKDVYADDYRVPKEYEICGFRPPKAGEIYLRSILKNSPIKATCDYEYCDPYLILKKRPETVVCDKGYTETKHYSLKDIYGTESVTLPAGYEYKDFRPALRGEYFLGSSGFVIWDGPTVYPMIIVGKCD